MGDTANREHVFKEYVETERKIKEALVDRNCGFKLAEIDIGPKSTGNHAVENNKQSSAYNVENYEKQPLSEILEMYMPAEKEY